MAVERAYEHAVPARGLWLRGILAERERVANHLGDIGAICNDVGFPFAQYQFTRLREHWLRDNLAWFGHRLLMDNLVPGGVAYDLSPADAGQMRDRIAVLRVELEELRPLLDNNHSLQDRLQGAGQLDLETARTLGCLGYVGRASGFDTDLRRESPYAPYDALQLEPVIGQEGDVAARLIVRFEETHASLKMLEQLLALLAPGPIGNPWPAPAYAAEGLGLVEGWRGEVLCYVRFDEQGRVARYYPRDPSVFNWPALERLIHGNIVPDFPLCNKSVNGSYAGHDL
jgi:Ni,Fe-hydrogenase III large subunit